MRSKEAGFTLLEVLAAMGVVAIAFTLLALTAISSSRLSFKAMEVPEARGVLANQLSELQQKGYRTLNACGVAPNNCTGTTTSATEYGTYQTTWTIHRDSPSNPALRSGFVRVDIATSWTKAGVTRRFSTSQLVTCLEDPGGTASNPYPECPL